jgi:hypothetical protein
MKVHPEMFMKTKERGKVCVPCARKMPEASKSEARGEREAS